jgi:hypothetical protein
VADWETVRAIAAPLPGTEESTSYGQPAFRVRKKLFAWVSPDDAAMGALATYVDEAEKELLVASDPAVYFATPHYAGYPIVLMRLEHADPERVRERVEDSWLLGAPKTLADAYAAEHE